MEMVLLVALPLVVVPVLLGLLRSRLGGGPGMARLWWPVTLAGLGAWMLPPGPWGALASGLYLVPALLLAAVGVSRLLLACRETVDGGGGLNWILGQFAVSVALVGPAILGWLLVARALGHSTDAAMVAKVLIGLTATGLVAGELCITSGMRWGVLAGAAAVVTAVLTAVPGWSWLIGVGITLVLVGLTLRREIRPVLPGAPGMDGVLGALAGIGVLVGSWFLPAAGVLMATLGLGGTAALWGRVVQRLSEPDDHSTGCSCCADHGSAAQADPIQQSG